MLPLAISGLLLVPIAQAASKWECRATDNGGWECLKDGLPVAPESPHAQPIEATASDTAQSARPAVPEHAVTRPLNEPSTTPATPLVAADPTPEGNQEPPPAEHAVKSAPAEPSPPTEKTAGGPREAQAVVLASEDSAPEPTDGAAVEAPLPTQKEPPATTIRQPAAQLTKTPPASVQIAQAASKWECQATSNGQWECLKDGLPVAPEGPSSQPIEATANGTALSARPPVPEQTVTRPLNEPSITTATPLVADDSTPEGNQEPPPAEHAVKSAPAEPSPPTERTAGGPGEGEAVVPASARKTEPANVPAMHTGTHSATATPLYTARIDQGLDWNQCNAKRPARAPVLSPAEDDGTQIDADAADYYRSEDRMEFSGNVQVGHGTARLEADRVLYDKASSDLDAEGNTYFQQPGLRITSSKLHYNLESQQGHAEQIEFRLTDPVARGSAGTADLEDANRSHYTNASYTTCRPGNSDWQISAEALEIDKATGVGVAHNAKLQFKGVPFIYLPYASFPIDDRRKSGFLAPSFGTSEKTGADVSIPYYFNIAPDMDATFAPRIMSKRGLLLDGEFRYLTEHNQGVIKGELLPNDSGQAATKNDTRGALSIQMNGTPAAHWGYDIDLNYVSDNDYINDLGSSLAATSVQHQERRGDLYYQGKGWNVLGRVQHYQTIDSSIAIDDRPYSRLPQLLLNLEKPNRSLGLTYHLRSEYVHFDHNSDTKVKGQRIDLQPALSLPMRRPWGFLTPKLGLRYTHYNLEDQAPGLSDSPSRTLPTFSIDGGLYFDRSGSWFGNAVTQTLEPRLFYLYTPKEDQSDIPDFDSAELDFSFANLFRENRFSGVDKVGDANQLTTALTSRTLSAESGEELFRASIGQIFYFRDRDVQLLSSGAEPNYDSSSIVAEVAARLSQNWRLQTGIQWSPHAGDGKTEESALGIHYLDDKKRILNLTYRYTDELIEQTDLSARWPITHQLHAVGRWNYSLLHGQTMESFAGIEYDSCCWITRFVVRGYRSDADTKRNMAVFLQLELKGLTSLGDKIDQFLERGILGYRTDN